MGIDVFFGGVEGMKSKQFMEGASSSNVICLIFALEMIQFDTSHCVKWLETTINWNEFIRFHYLYLYSWGMYHDFLS